MNKFRSQLAEIRSFLDDANLIVEVRDARGPAITSAERYLGRKKPVRRVVVLAKADLADPDVTKAWIENPGPGVDRVVSLDLSGINSKPGMWMKKLLEGYVGKVKSALGLVRAVVVGLPNVGKSTLINRLRKARVAEVGDQPGVTRGKRWVQISPECYVLDTPGIIQISGSIMNRFGDEAWKLSLLNVVPENAMEAEETAMGLIGHIRRAGTPVKDVQLVKALDRGRNDLEVLVAVAQAQGLKTSGGDPDIVTASRRLIGRFRRIELGRITLEAPVEVSREASA